MDRGAVGRICFHLEIATLHLQAGRNLLSGRSSIFIIQGFLRATFFKLQIKGMKLTQVGRYSCSTKPGLEEASVILYTDDPVNLAVHTGRKKVPQVECYHFFALVTLTLLLAQVRAKEGVSTILPCRPTHPSETKDHLHIFQLPLHPITEVKVTLEHKSASSLSREAKQEVDQPVNPSKI